MSGRKFSRRAVLFGVAGAFGAVSLPRVTWAAAERELGGRPFSDPAEVTPMPATWTGRAVRRPEGADLALAIDQQLFPAIQPMVRAWAVRQGLKVALVEGTCGIAADALASKTADITGMCCPPGPLDRLPGALYHTIGISAVALLVHPGNPLSEVDLATARKLFGGDIRSWADLPVSGVGTMGQRVQAVARLHCATRPGHWRLLLDNPDLFSLNVVEVPAIADMLRHVAGEPSAIGYETLWHVADKLGAGKVKALRLNGHRPEDDDAVARGLYPIYRVFNITSWSKSPAADARAAALARHLVDSAAQIDASFGIIPAARLRAAGWRFVGDEVVGEPGRV